jgi:vitamin B12 transporter
MSFSGRFTRIFSVLSIGLVSVLTSIASAEIRIQVVDPQGAVVAGAEVQLLKLGKPAPAAVLSTSAEGLAIFRETASNSGPYRIQVLAPGFAAETVDLSQTAEVITIKLRVATAAETVVVTATRTPVPSQAAGAEVETLNREQLQAMNPVAANDAIRFLPGAVVNTAGQRGGLSSLFVRGGDSRYNKVIVDGVSVTEPGGTIDFGTLSLAEAGRLEFLRGAQSTLYGSDAMTSVVQVWTRTGNTSVPELRFGADAGNYGTENGYASLAGTHGRFDYNVFGNQFNTAGSGPNDDYSNSLEGANVGLPLSDQISLRLRARHDHSATGVPGAWNFNGTNVFDVGGITYVLSPDLGGRASQNNTLASLDLAVKTGSKWTHHFTGFEYNLQTTNLDSGISPENTPFGTINTPFEALVSINRAGFDYQGDYVERTWAETTIGYQFEDENGSVADPIPETTPPTGGHGLRLNEAVYVQQALTIGRLSVIAGGRFVHNTTFGNTGVPRVALGFQASRGGRIFSGTRLNFSYATGIKEPRFEETFVSSQYQLPNLNLKAERNRAFEAGFQQNLLGRFVLVANYFNNLFHDQIEFVTINPTTFLGEYVNLQKSFAQGAEVELQSRLTQRLSWNTSYTYTSTQILASPGNSPPYAQGDPLLRRPRHSAATLLTYLCPRWGTNLGGSFVGPRPDSDFDGFGINHTPGYFLLDVGGWYRIHSRVNVYANVENALNHFYEEVTGYPALRANVRAGLRFRIGGE